MQKGFLKSYSKKVYREIVKYIKQYIKDIIDEINVKSFKKYKYNFLCEFIGSFVFVFFISIYMLNSNSSEDYIIKRSKQINPYRMSEIFIQNENILDTDLNNFMDSPELDVKYSKDYLQNVMLEMEITDNPKMMNEIPSYLKDIEIETNDTIVNDLNDEIENDIENEINKDILNEPVIKDVDDIIFQDELNEYSKIKISDINNIDLENIDRYEKVRSYTNSINKHHSIYTILGCLIYVVFVILGAHINPAYTYALWLLEPKKYGLVLSSCYVGFQYFGGILASVLVGHIYGSVFIYSLLPKKEVMKTFACESVCTFILTVALISLYKYKKQFMKETAEEKDTTIFRQIRNVTSCSSVYDDLGGYDGIKAQQKNKGFVKLHIGNKYVKYIINHLYFFTFVFCAHLFFIFISNTSLNPIFSTSTLYTYFYFKLFQSSGTTVNILALCKSLLTPSRLLQMIILYIHSLPFWLGPYVGSTLATICIQQIKQDKEEIDEEDEEEEKEQQKKRKIIQENEEIEDDEDDETIRVIDTSIYKKNKNKEKVPLLSKMYFRQNAYLEEYHDNINQNIQTFVTPIVF